VGSAFCRHENSFREWGTCEWSAVPYPETSRDLGKEGRGSGSSRRVGEPVGSELVGEDAAAEVESCGELVAGRRGHSQPALQAAADPSTSTALARLGQACNPSGPGEVLSNKPASSGMCRVWSGE
jgi:hypothetical protein